MTLLPVIADTALVKEEMMLTPKAPLHPSLVAALQDSYRSKRTIFHLYRFLADREPLESRQELLLMLARNAEQSAANDATRLLHLDGTIPADPIALSDSLWRWLLVSCRLKTAMLWIEWLAKQSVHPEFKS